MELVWDLSQNCSVKHWTVQLLAMREEILCLHFLDRNLINSLERLQREQLVGLSSNSKFNDNVEIGEKTAKYLSRPSFESFKEEKG